jgi:hypothetical protein
LNHAQKLKLNRNKARLTKRASDTKGIWYEPIPFPFTPLQ